MAVRRKRNGAGELEFIVILGALGALAYVLYKAIPSAAAAASNAAASVSSAAAGMAPLQTINLNQQYQIPGTGQTVSDLIAAGWSQPQIDQLLAQATETYGTPAVSVTPTIDVSPSPYYPFSSITGWLTGS